MQDLGDSLMKKRYGKPIDIAEFKKPVLENIHGHLQKITSIVEYLSKQETPIQQSTCYICGSSEADPFAEIYGFTYLLCQTCGHYYTSTRYSDDAILRFYKKNTYWAESTYANKETCHYRREQVARPKVEFAEQHSEKIEDGLWIDIGSGIGDLVSIAAEHGWKTLGLELSETSVAFAKEIFNVTLEPTTLDAYLAQHPELVGSAHMVSAIGLLEHTVAPMRLLRQAHSLLVPEGSIMIQVPNGNSLASQVQSVFPKNVFRHMSPIEHIMVFSETSLRRALNDTGFEPVAFWYHGLDIYELLTNLVLINEKVRTSALYGTIMTAMNELQQVIDQRELSDRIICVARKKPSSKEWGHGEIPNPFG